MLFLKCHAGLFPALFLDKLYRRSIIVHLMRLVGIAV